MDECESGEGKGDRELGTRAEVIYGADLVFEIGEEGEEEEEAEEVEVEHGFLP